MIIYENPFERALTGQEVKDWIWHHSHEKTMFTKIAKGMMSYFNRLDNQKFYMAYFCDNIPVVKEVPERGKYYEIPCDSSNGH